MIQGVFPCAALLCGDRGAVCAVRACVLTCVQLFCQPVDCSPAGSSVHGISQARILEQVAISSSGIFWTQGLNPGDLVYLLHWQTDSLPLYHLGGKPSFCWVASYSWPSYLWNFSLQSDIHGSAFQLHFLSGQTMQMTPFCARQGKMWEAPQTEPCPSSAQEKGPLGGIPSPPPASPTPLQPPCPEEEFSCNYL